ncbi:HTH domain-containing protein [Billgrantia desiderata]|uniref:HTH domain-containing protein n=1 Tax=Billgrantia desiderata TaxID=52021 RepID=UPI00089E5E0C|nr:HTH domain-containing protein [Halomonas desiderata]SEF41274.1 HTH domain-containing protein [Halomonas desiderata]
MSRTTRLLELLQILRRHRCPVSGTALAQELGVSLRTPAAGGARTRVAEHPAARNCQ